MKNIENMSDLNLTNMMTSSRVWRHQGWTFSVLRVLCEENPPVTGGAVKRIFDVCFDLRPNKRLKKTIEPPVIWDAIALIMTSL